MQEVIQVALHREGLEQELLVVLLARRVTHQDTPTQTTTGELGLNTAALPKCDCCKFAVAMDVATIQRVTQKCNVPA